MHQEHRFTTPAILLQPILMMESLSLIFKTFRVHIQLYPEKFRKCLMYTKNHRNGIQLLCANLDPVDTIAIVR
jgi:hypothetical protein